MKIAIFIDSFLPQINGVVTHVVDTACELMKKGHRVIIFAPKSEKGKRINLSTYPFKVFFLPSLPAMIYPDYRIAILSLPKIMIELRKFKPDIVHVMDPFTVCSEGIMAAKLTKIPIVITFHTFFMDHDFLKNVKLEGGARLISKPVWKLTAFYHNLADAVICPSVVSQKELESHGLKKPTVVIPNGLNLKEIKNLTIGGKKDLTKTFGIKNGAKTAIYVGRLAADKNLDVLLKSWKLVNKVLPKTKLLIVGDGPKKRHLKNLTKMLGIKESVVFTGPISRDRILKKGIYNLADVFVTASKIENHSLSMLEAMAHGLPLIGVNARGTPELIDDQNGILVETDKSEFIADAMIKLFTDEDLRKKLSKGSLLKIKKYDISQMLNKLEAIYRVLVKFKSL